jgi:hypothetical protein
LKKITMVLFLSLCVLGLFLIAACKDKTITSHKDSRAAFIVLSDSNHVIFRMNDKKVDFSYPKKLESKMKKLLTKDSVKLSYDTDKNGINTITSFTKIDLAKDPNPPHLMVKKVDQKVAVFQTTRFGYFFYKTDDFVFVQKPNRVDELHSVTNNVYAEMQAMDPSTNIEAIKVAAKSELAAIGETQELKKEGIANEFLRNSTIFYFTATNDKQSESIFVIDTFGLPVQIKLFIPAHSPKAIEQALLSILETIDY